MPAGPIRALKRAAASSASAAAFSSRARRSLGASAWSDIDGTETPAKLRAPIDVEVVPLPGGSLQYSGPDQVSGCGEPAS